MKPGRSPGAIPRWSGARRPHAPCEWDQMVEEKLEGFRSMALRETPRPRACRVKASLPADRRRGGVGLEG